MEINEIKNKIQSLIDKATADNERQKKVLKFLFDKLNEVKELETIERIRDNPKFLNAYLIYKSITRGNFQPEIAEHINYGSDDGQDKLLVAIARDVEQWEKDNADKVPADREPSNRKILIWLSERLGTNEIKRELTQFASLLMVEDEAGIFKLDLKDGKLDPDPVAGFLDKHGLGDGGEVERAKGLDRLNDLLTHYGITTQNFQLQIKELINIYRADKVGAVVVSQEDKDRIEYLLNLFNMPNDCGCKQGSKCDLDTKLWLKAKK